MTGLDVAIFSLYLVALLGLGAVLSRQIATSKDLFAAGGRSPWWLAGISAYMTMFSSGTFVVWGGIAFKHGLVATSICLTYGFSALIVGYAVAARWKATGVGTPAEFVRLRFGDVAVQLFTWLGILFRLLGVGVALYSVSVMVAALIPLEEGNPLRDPGTGNLAVAWAIIVAGVVVVGYTIAGGLWSVLVTDVLQFIVLTVAVCMVVPLILERAGGWSGFVDNAPESFLAPTADEFTWVFLTAWVVIHAFKIGGEWAFAQRFLCVPTARDARRATYLFGVLYLVTPALWMLPPMVYRVVDPSANHEQAYILACQSVLPAGMIGLVIAAMFSATASMVDSEINVFAGAVTRDIWARASGVTDERRLVRVGRVVTLMLGASITGVALAVPMLGGAETVILTITGLFTGPLVLPTVWGLLSPRIGLRALITTIFISAAASALLKFGLDDVAWIAANARVAEVAVGILVPVIVLTLFELSARRVDPGWDRVAALRPSEGDVRQTSFPGAIVRWSLFTLAALLSVVAVAQESERPLLLVTAGILCVLALTPRLFARMGVVLVLCGAVVAQAPTDDRPNILWIVAEDLSPNLGCYGDTVARTPNVDALARRGIRFTRAYATAPVCSSARSSLFTGVEATRLGTQHHRSKGRLPAAIRLFPAYLRDAGYWCVNRTKTDYNFAVPSDAWDQCSRRAHWRNRPEGRPFFAAFHVDATHESKVWGSAYTKTVAKVEPKTDPAAIRVPPWHPDVPEVRADWARHYDTISAMDARVGRILADLESDGLDDDTIVFFFSDHGTGLPRSKGTLYECGLRVPMIVSVPKRWRGLADLAPGTPFQPGASSSRLVSFTSLAPTVFRFTGVAPPPHLAASPAFGPSPPDLVTAFRSRTGEVIDVSRAVITQRYKYIHNFHPHRPYAPTHRYSERSPTLKALRRLAGTGTLPPIPARYMALEEKPREELYDLHADPDELNNLAGDTKLIATRRRLAGALRASLGGLHPDLGLVPESDYTRRFGSNAPWDVAAKNLPREALIEAALLVGDGPQARALMHRAVAHADPAVRYWGLTALAALGEAARPSWTVIRPALSDSAACVRLAAARAAAAAGHGSTALGPIRRALTNDDASIRLAAADAAQALGTGARPLAPQLDQLATKDPVTVVRSLCRTVADGLRPSGR